MVHTAHSHISYRMVKFEEIAVTIDVIYLERTAFYDCIQ